MKFLITGAEGQLARELVSVFEKRCFNFVALSKSQLDITKLDDVLNAFSFYKPSIVINCAAYNYVDQAERDYIKAYEVNALGVRNIAFCCTKIKAFLIHYSTDYVFDGKKQNSLYTEEDAPNPINEYGKSKLAGEQFVLAETQEFLLLRVSWVFGKGQNNFVYKFLNWSRGKEFIKVSCDEFSIPTWTNDIVNLTLDALNKDLKGIFHLTSSGFCSRFEWANKIKEFMDLDVFVRPAYSTEFELLAKRPQFSAMNNEKICNALGISVRHWSEALFQFLKEGGFC